MDRAKKLVNISNILHQFCFYKMHYTQWKFTVQEDVQCHQDQDCIDSDKCVEGTCIEACLTTKCGLNAQCKAISHTGICYCAPEFTGNAYIECIRGIFYFIKYFYI